MRTINERTSVTKLKLKYKVTLIIYLNTVVCMKIIIISSQELDSAKNEAQRGRIKKTEFIEIYKDLMTRPEVYFLMVRYANKDYLTWEDLQLFLETEQGVCMNDNIFVKLRQNKFHSFTKVSNYSKRA